MNLRILIQISGLLAILLVGPTLIAPTGPGSDRIVYVLLGLYGFALMLLHDRTSRVFGWVLLIGSVGGFAQSQISMNHFREAAAQQMQIRGRSATQPE